MKLELKKITKMSVLTLITVAVLLSACNNSPVANEDTTESDVKAGSQTELVLASDIQWSPLNPARGDNSPQAGTIWGDRNGSGPTGFLVKFKDGFSSPPHIHNITYRGVVISGTIHNDDPEAASMWMPAGSFWTQPAGEGHITSTQGEINMAYIEIESGPYLVKPTEDAFDNGERPVNIEQSNIVWLDATNMEWFTSNEKAANSAKVAFLWGQPQELYGTLIRLPAGFKGTIHSDGRSFRAVVVKGHAQYYVNEGDSKALDVGSSFSSQGTSTHNISNQNEEESMLYIRAKGKYEITAEN